MTRALSEELDDVAGGTVTASVVGGLLSVLPFAPPWTPPGRLAEAAARLDPALAERVAARAEALARAEGPQRALAAFAFLDKGDAGIAVFSGLRGAVKTARGEDGALETDPQQAADAGIKALGLAWAAWRLFDGSVQDRANALLATEAGRALLTWYVAADVVLPFADNVATGGVDLFRDLVERHALPSAVRLALVAGPDAEAATGMLRQLSATMSAALQQAATFARPLSEWAGEKLPGLLSGADAVSGVVATGADALPAYRLLGASLVAEVLLARALAEVQAEVAAEHEAAERARREAEAAAENARREAEAAAENARREAEAAKSRSAQREDYTLDKAEPAASLSSQPVKYTKTGGDVPAKSGCFGCMGVVLLAVIGSAAGAWYLV